MNNDRYLLYDSEERTIAKAREQGRAMHARLSHAKIYSTLRARCSMKFKHRRTTAC